MTRIDSYEDLTDNIVRWLKDYYWQHSIDAFVVGVSGGIDSAVVSSLCARRGLPSYVVCMPLESKFENSKLSDVHSKTLAEKYDNVKRIEVELSSVYDGFINQLNGGLKHKIITKKNLPQAHMQMRILITYSYGNSLSDCRICWWYSSGYR